jgi:hypothetical protein
MDLAEIKKWRANGEGGELFTARLFVAAARLRSGRNPVDGEVHLTGGCQSRLHPIIETIHFSDYSKSKVPISIRRSPD